MPGGAPSISVTAVMYYKDSSGVQKTVAVIADAPLAGNGYIDRLHNRIAGFVFTEEDFKDGQCNAVNVTYVESSMNDLEPLDHDDKDALLEDRALIVHRLIQNTLGKKAKNYPTEVSKPLYLPVIKPDASGFPPVRTLTTKMTIHLADPRWPFAKPNSLCLECGRDPKVSGGKLLLCSKCGVRLFCSKECMDKSWKSDVWCHRMECERKCAHEESTLGKSMREMFNGLLGKQEISPAEVERRLAIMEKSMGQAALDEKFETVPEMREKLRQDAKGARKAQRSAKKKKGKGKGKKK